MTEDFTPGRHSGLTGTQTGLYNPGSEIRQVQGMADERGGSARASGDTKKKQDNIQNKYIYCDIA